MFPRLVKLVSPVAADEDRPTVVTPVHRAPLNSWSSASSGLLSKFETSTFSMAVRVAGRAALVDPVSGPHRHLVHELLGRDTVGGIRQRIGAGQITHRLVHQR